MLGRLQEIKKHALKRPRFCLKACPELDETLPLEPSQRKRSFNALQEILRACGPDVVEEVKEKLVKMAQKHLKMPVLAAVLGNSKESRVNDRKHDKGIAMSSCPFRFQLSTSPDTLARPIGFDRFSCARLQTRRVTWIWPMAALLCLFS